MDKNYDDMVTIDEFIKVYMEAEAVLERKLQKSTQNIAEFKDQQTRIYEDRQEAQYREKLNQYNISQDSELTCTILSSQGHAMYNDDPSQMVQLFLQVSINSQKAKLSAPVGYS